MYVIKDNTFNISVRNLVEFMCLGGLMTQERTAQWENDKEFIGRIESQLTEKLGISPIVSNDGTLSFYKLR